MPSSDEANDLLGLSLNELVSFCKEAGFPQAHRGLAKEDLVGFLEGTKTPYGIVDPIDVYRTAVMGFIEDHKDALQLECHGDCRLHSAAKVIQCHMILNGET